MRFAVGRGEIVGLAGGPGPGNTELANRLAGLARHYGGAALLDGQPLSSDNPARNIDRGLGYVPSDRYVSGMVPHLSLADNITLPILDASVSPAGHNGRRSPDAPSRRWM